MAALFSEENPMAEISASGSDVNPGGYEANFVQPLPNGLKCPICHRALREPVQADCTAGHRFCRRCIMELRGDTSPFPCPVCKKMLLEENFHNDNACKREVLHLRVLCWHKDECEWRGVLQDLERHLKRDCAFENAGCPNGCEAADIWRRDLRHHLDEECPLRKCSCPTCHSEFPVAERDEHQDVCPKADVTCELCGQDLQRDQIPRHNQEECPEFELECTFSSCGCPFKGNRKRVNAHSQESTALAHHLDLLQREQARRNDNQGKELAATKEELAATKEQLAAVSNENAELRETVHQLQLHIQQRQDTQEDKLEENAERIATIERNLHHSEHHHFLQQLGARDRRLTALEDDSGWRNGKLRWPIMDFAQKYEEAIQGRTEYSESPFFHTEEGFKVRARIYLNGSGAYRNSYISLYVLPVRTSVDSVLPFPIEKTVEFRLCNQKGGEDICRSMIIGRENSASRVVDDSHPGSGCPDLAPLRNVLNTTIGFLENDKIIVSIEFHYT